VEEGVAVAVEFDVDGEGKLAGEVAGELVDYREGNLAGHGSGDGVVETAGEVKCAIDVDGAVEGCGHESGRNEVRGAVEDELADAGANTVEVEEDGLAEVPCAGHGPVIEFRLKGVMNNQSSNQQISQEDGSYE
jgi:hypothetical protein